MAVHIDNHGGDDTLRAMHAANAEIRRFYRWNAPIYDWTRWMILRDRRSAAEALQLRPGQSVLEIGCGTGLNLKRLRRAVGPTGRIVGVDVSADMLARARCRAAANALLVCADAAELDVSRQFDGVLLTYALTIIPKWRAALERARAHLAPGGRLVILDFGHTNHPMAIHRRLFEGYLHLSRVFPERDLLKTMAGWDGSVEVLRPVTGYALLLRHVRL